MSILDKARGEQNWLEKIGNYIPGFKGYRDKELRRDADKLQREHMAGRLDECKRGLNDISVAATRSGNLGIINDIETARKRLDKVANRIRYADRGYSGFFDTIKVDAAKLEQAYQFDLQLLEVVESLRQSMSATEAAADMTAAVRALIAEVDALDTRLGEREQILGGMA